jgi:hypothetical protein
VTQIETAAGVEPGAGALRNAPVVMSNCVATGPADNSCAKAAKLAECSANRCPTECAAPSTCM